MTDAGDGEGGIIKKERTISKTIYFYYIIYFVYFVYYIFCIFCIFCAGRSFGFYSAQRDQGKLRVRWNNVDDIDDEEDDQYGIF